MQHNNSKQRIEKIARQNLSSLGYGTGTKKVLYRGICVPSNYPLTRETWIVSDSTIYPDINMADHSKIRLHKSMRYDDRPHKYRNIDQAHYR